MGTTLRTPLYSGVRNSGTHRFHVLCVVLGLQQFNDGEEQELHKIAMSCLGWRFVGTVGTVVGAHYILL